MLDRRARVSAKRSGITSASKRYTLKTNSLLHRRCMPWSLYIHCPTMVASLAQCILFQAAWPVPRVSGISCPYSRNVLGQVGRVRRFRGGSVKSCTKAGLCQFDIQVCFAISQIKYTYVFATYSFDEAGKIAE